MKISREHKAHMKKIAPLGGNAVKKKMPEGYYKKIIKMRWDKKKKKSKK